MCPCGHAPCHMWFTHFRRVDTVGEPSKQRAYAFHSTEFKKHMLLRLNSPIVSRLVALRIRGPTHRSAPTMDNDGLILLARLCYMKYGIWLLLRPLTLMAGCRMDVLSGEAQTANDLLERRFVNVGFVLRRNGNDVKHPAVSGHGRVGHVDLDDAVDRRWA